MSSTRGPVLAAPAGLSALPDFRLLLYLFLGLRLVLLLAQPPQLVQVPAGRGAAENAPVFERGLTVYGDFLYHFGIAENSRLGLLPYRDFWYEYPPLIPVVSGAVYYLSGSNYLTYASLLALLLTAFDAGTVLLMRRLGNALHGAPYGETLAWAYALMAAPAVLAFWNLEAMVTFWTMLALWWLVCPRDTGHFSVVAAGLSIAGGALTKLVPLALLGAVWRFRGPPQAARISAVALLVTGAGLAGVLAFGPRYGAASLTVQFQKASFQTIWALLDGNYGTGVFDDARLDLDAAFAMRGNPPLVSPALRLGVFAALGLFAYTTTRHLDSVGLVLFVTLTIVLVYMWSAGWSTQWQALLIPLMLLTLPLRAGVLLALCLSIVSFAEYPLLFARASDASGVLLSEAQAAFRLTVVARTVILAGLGLYLYRRLRLPATAPDVERAHA